jgi:predicted lysophospholipase L1 biosynthesis ABC-type transport system permease subunit
VSNRDHTATTLVVCAVATGACGSQLSPDRHTASGSTVPVAAPANARRGELSVRLALGGSRWRLARLLFVESLLVAVTGAALGLVFAKWSSALLVQQLGTWESTVSLDLALDWRVLVFTATLTCLCAIRPAWRP